ncbi:hypothetical protein BT93_K0462 [Corymbia citriodora subsp. variegata]|nr:hypothetical protein BT93_K0462 [Corymbia citriodora subsp. variegata]
MGRIIFDPTQPTHLTPLDCISIVRWLHKQLAGGVAEMTLTKKQEEEICLLCRDVLLFALLEMSGERRSLVAPALIVKCICMSVIFIHGDDESITQIILFRRKEFLEVAYAYGFYCNGNCNSYLFTVFIIQLDDNGLIAKNGIPRVVWSANRNNPVKIDATLELTSEGDLVLKDADGTVAWSTNTSAKSVVGLNLTDFGNLVLFDKDDAIVWQSFNHPTDSLVIGQKLRPGQRLTPSVSKTNWTVDRMIKLSATSPMNISESLISVPGESSSQYMKLGSDGHLRVYEPNMFSYGWNQVADLFTRLIGDCSYPTACGQYGICSDGLCSCPTSNGGTSYFQQVDDKQPNLGCSEIFPLSCGASQQQSFMELENVAYFQFTPDLEDIDASHCKEACAENCSCKVAIFQYKSNRTNGSCFLPTQVFSFVNVNEQKFPYNYTTYLKVQTVTNKAPYTPVDNRTTNRLPIIFGFSLGAFFAMMISIVAIVLFVQNKDDNQADEDYLDQVPGMPNRFTYNDLKTITEEFDKKLGEGGFGTLSDGTKVAVKRLDGFGQVKKSFLAEVETIGNIHHVNLKIVHLDIKPQNILLDGNFNAKVADFGLSKLIDKDQSQVVTTMRGTPGYLAPEWLSVAITEKVDVYSFGVVILEIVCGRKIFDRSLDQEDIIFKRKAKEERLLDVVDKSSNDMRVNGPHAVNMMRIAAWCLQGDYMKRPSMSMVIKALEGMVEVQEDLDYDFSALPSTSGAARFGPMDIEFSATTTLLPSVLSGP